MLLRILYFSICVWMGVSEIFGKSENEGAPSEKALHRTARSPSNKNNNEEFEKFFLKASKSVPRIGRRGYGFDEKEHQSNEVLNRLAKIDFLKTINKRTNRNRAPLWNHIADIVEYNPEVLNSPEFLASLAMEQGDDPSTYDWETPIKRNNIPIQAKEVPEYLAQAQF